MTCLSHHLVFSLLVAWEHIGITPLTDLSASPKQLRMHPDLTTVKATNFPMVRVGLVAGQDYRQGMAMFRVGK